MDDRLPARYYLDFSCRCENILILMLKFVEPRAMVDIGTIYCPKATNVYRLPV